MKSINQMVLLSVMIGLEALLIYGPISVKPIFAAPPDPCVEHPFPWDVKTENAKPVRSQTPFLVVGGIMRMAEGTSVRFAISTITAILGAVLMYFQFLKVYPTVVL